MAVCKARTKSGKPCGMRTAKGGRYCFTHDPARARDRAEARRKGGQAQATPHAGSPETIPADIRTINDARPLLGYVLAELLVMDNSIPRARALLALFDSHVKAFEIGELEARIKALEERLTP